MGKLKWIFTSLVLVILLISLTISFLLFLIIINKELVIDENNVDWFDMLIKSSFTLVGSTLSGFVAILVFYLNYLREKKNDKAKSKRLLKLISKDFNNKKEMLDKISEVISTEPTEKIADYLLHSESEVLELFIITSAKIADNMLEESIQDLENEDQMKILEPLSVLKSCKSILSLITSGIKSKENLKLLIDQLKKDLVILQNFPKFDVE